MQYQCYANRHGKEVRAVRAPFVRWEGSAQLGQLDMDTLGSEPSYRSGSVRCSTEAAAGAAAFVTLDIRRAMIAFRSVATQRGFLRVCERGAPSSASLTKLAFWRAYV